MHELSPAELVAGVRRDLLAIAVLVLCACHSPHGSTEPDATADGPVIPKAPGLGGELTPTGASFRVWAPDADAHRHG